MCMYSSVRPRSGNTHILVSGEGARSSSKRQVIGKGFGVGEQTPSPSPSHNLLYYVHHSNFPLVHEYLTPAGDLNSVDRKHRFSGGGGARVLEGAEIGWLALC